MDRPSRALCASPEIIENLPRHPNGTHEKIDRPLKERGTIAFQLVSQKEQHPAANEQPQLYLPMQQDDQNAACEHNRCADRVKRLISRILVFVVVPPHVFLKS